MFGKLQDHRIAGALVIKGRVVCARCHKPEVDHPICCERRALILGLVQTRGAVGGDCGGPHALSPR